MGTRQPLSEHTVYGRSCTICAHAELGDIDHALVANGSVSQLAQQHGVSRDALYRHLKWHLRPAVQQALPSVPSVRPLSLVERYAEIADAAQTARRSAYASGNAALGARLGDAETRALDSLADRFKIDHASVAADRAREAQVARAVDRALKLSPELAALVAAELEAEGLRDMAAELRPEIQKAKGVAR
jgi:transposase-like protein